MKRTIASSATAAVAAFALLFALSGCAGGSGGTTPTDDTEDSEPADPGYGGGDAALMTADSSLGEIVVDGKGMTVYMFDNDTQGATSSSCSGQCAQNWPAVTTDSDAPQVEGVTGEVATIIGVDGKTQVTLDGWPLYYFVGDEAAGDVNGQGVNDVWWVLSPAGERMAE